MKETENKNMRDMTKEEENKNLRDINI